MLDGGGFLNHAFLLLETCSHFCFAITTLEPNSYDTKVIHMNLLF